MLWFILVITLAAAVLSTVNAILSRGYYADYIWAARACILWFLAIGLFVLAGT